MSVAQPQANKPAVIYAAKSTTDERGSIPTQLQDGRLMADREQWEVIGEYSDEAASAWTSDRGPQLAAAMQHAERVAPSVLVVQHSDRLARGDGRTARHLVELYFWALKVGVELRSVQDDSTFTNPLLAVAMGERNAEDSRRKALAVAAGMRRRAASGKANGAAPYGYVFGPHHSGLVVVADEAVIVVRIFSEWIAGRPLAAIARGLNCDGVLTKKGRRWRQSTVGLILANPVYVGEIRHKGETFDAEHEPIIDHDTWERAADLLAARPKRGKGRPSKGGHLFQRGMLRCECGEAMIARTEGGRSYYYCNGRREFGPDFCSMKSIYRADIDGAVYRYFEQVGLDVEATRDQLADARDRKLSEVRALRAEAEREAQLAADRLARVRRDYQDGKLAAEDWAEQREELSAERIAAQEEAKRLQEQEADVEQHGSLLDVEEETLRHLADIREAITDEVQRAEGVEAVRATLSRMFECFVVHMATPERIHIELAGEPWIEPVVRERAVQGYSESMRPILHREPLTGIGEKQQESLHT